MNLESESAERNVEQVEALEKAHTTAIVLYKAFASSYSNVLWTHRHAQQLRDRIVATATELLNASPDRFRTQKSYDHYLVQQFGILPHSVEFKSAEEIAHQVFSLRHWQNTIVTTNVKDVNIMAILGQFSNSTSFASQPGDEVSAATAAEADSSSVAATVDDNNGC